jgi:hypothetical protein
MDLNSYKTYINILSMDRLMINTEINNYILSESTVINIIENYHSIGIYLCTLCDEQIHGIKEQNNEYVYVDPSFEDILRHVQSHSIKINDINIINTNDFPTLFICDQCDFECFSGLEYQQHINSHDVEIDSDRNDSVSETSDDDEYIFYRNNRSYSGSEDSDRYDEESETESEDYEDPYDNHEYKYKCMICTRGYDDYVELKEHFVKKHIIQPKIGQLGNESRGGFPGFDLLNKIGMTRFVRVDEMIDDDMCLICCDKYDPCIEGNMDLMIVKKTKNEKWKQFNDDMRIMYLDHIDYEPKYPMKLLCCGQTICSKCLKNQLESKRGIPECPFCKKDHTMTTCKFIISELKELKL